MQGSLGWRQLAVERSADLLADERKLQWTLRLYTAFSQIAVVLGIVVPILAGSTVLASIQNVAGWPIITGLLTLVASVLVAIHKGLNCDAFHGRCREALAELRSIAMSYERLLSRPPAEDHHKALGPVEARLDRFYQSFCDVLPIRATRLLADRH
jgi:hypothetical protein